MQPPPAAVPLTYKDFTGGFDSRNHRDGTPPNASADALDLELTSAGHLRAMPGTSEAVEIAGHRPRQMVLHASLSGWAELVLFDPPYIGVYGANGLEWQDIGLSPSATPFAHAAFGEDLIFFSRGESAFIRPVGGTAVAAPGIPRAQAYATFAGRLYALGVEIEGRFEPMAAWWSSISGDPKDFTGASSQTELLIDSMVAGDKIVAGVTMGLSMMAILCRRSIWVAIFTGDLFRPGDLQSRVVGAGCVAAETAKATPLGVIYLAEDGVRLFDGNQSIIISPPINKELLPLLPEFYNDYSASYDPIRNQYILHTPVETWILDLERRIWFRSSLRANSSVLFAEQIAGTTWAALTGDWNSLNDTTWRELDNRETDSAAMHFLQATDEADSKLHLSDYASSSYFGTEKRPYWTTPMNRGQGLDNVVELKGVSVEYNEGAGELRLSVPDINGHLEVIRQDTLFWTHQPRLVHLPKIHTGLGIAAKLELLSGLLEIIQFQLMIVPASRRIGSLVNLFGGIPGPEGPFPNNDPFDAQGAFGPGKPLDPDGPLGPDGPFGPDGPVDEDGSPFGPGGAFGPDGPGGDFEGIPHTQHAFTAEGEHIFEIVGGYVLAWVTIAGGGGGGGSTYGTGTFNGGGGGGRTCRFSTYLAPGVYTVTVGKGGNPGSVQNVPGLTVDHGDNGGNSGIVGPAGIGGVTMFGGGGGGSNSVGSPGGSGGGGGFTDSGGGAPGGAAVPGPGTWIRVPGPYATVEDITGEGTSGGFGPGMGGGGGGGWGGGGAGGPRGPNLIATQPAINSGRGGFGGGGGFEGEFGPPEERQITLWAIGQFGADGFAVIQILDEFGPGQGLGGTTTKRAADGSIIPDA